MRNVCTGVTSAVCAGLVIGCATPEDHAGEPWITARVMQVRRAGEAGRSADTRCLDPAVRDEELVVVVRYRSARMARDRALPMPAADAVQVGDTVAVDLQHCVLRRLHEP